MYERNPVSCVKVYGVFLSLVKKRHHKRLYVELDGIMV